ncbi:MAG: MopE-related protein [Thermodesulfobacteriota bacterium]
MKKNRKTRVPIFLFSTLFCLFFLLMPISSGAAIIYVDADAAGAGTGASWADAYRWLQQALNSAASGDQIWVAQGTYIPTEDINGDQTPAYNRNKIFYFSASNISLYGGFAGGETTLEERDWENNVTVLSGDLNRDDNSGGDTSDNAKGVIRNTYSLNIIDGFTITAAYEAVYGGGVYCPSGSVAVKNCVITKNHASGGGATYGYVNLTDCVITENIAKRGGAIYSTSTTAAPSLTNCIVSGNTAYKYLDGEGTGGAVYITGNQPVLKNCIISGNYAEGAGGGIYSKAGDTNISPKFYNCTITANYAPMGGGIYNSYPVSEKLCTPLLVNCILWKNSSANPTHYQVYNFNSTLTVPSYLNCDIEGSYGSGSYWNGYLGVDSGGNIDWDPAFYTPVLPASAPTAAGDFHIPLTSHCVNAGNGANADVPDYDMENEPRDATPDIGADECLDTDGDGVRDLDDSDDDGDGIPDEVETAAGMDSRNRDTDGDGLEDNEEDTDLDGVVDSGETDPVNMDTDGDNIPDGWEADQGLDPLDPADGEEDWDSDGADNATEYTHNTDPMDSDTDDDNMPDGWEVANTLDPLADDAALDPDFDRISNLEEYAGATDPRLYHIYTGVIYVDGRAAGADNGTSWANAFVFLQDGLAAAGTIPGGAVVWVASGTYYPDEGGLEADGDRYATFHLLDGMAVYGGFAGTESSLSERALSINSLSVLSGDLDQNDAAGGDNSENAYHVAYFVGVSDQTVLDGFTITGGNANSTEFNTYTDVRGGGVFNTSGNPRIINCYITDNHADIYGGGIYNNRGNLLMSNCAVSGNSAGDDGGGMYNYVYELTLNPVIESSPTVINSVFTGNFAGDDGGAMYNHAYGGIVSPTLINCTFTGNNTDSVGSEFYNYVMKILNVKLGVCEPQFTNCIIWNDSAVYNSDAVPAYAYCDIKGSGGSDSWVASLGTDLGGNIDSDPLFVDSPDPASAPAAAGDVHLQAGSPCIDAGTATGAPATDVDGNTRDALPDIGADEWVLDTDGDGEPDETDGCPYDASKIDPGVCGCGVPDTDTDGDGVADCNDGCPDDPDKTDPGVCGCGVPETDADGDGYYACEDCDDTNAGVYPGAEEICDDGMDNNCDGFVDEECECIDEDGDGYCNDVDCNDSNPSVYPGATEIRGDLVDNNCNGWWDELTGESGDGSTGVVCFIDTVTKNK